MAATLEQTLSSTPPLTSTIPTFQNTSAPVVHAANTEFLATGSDPLSQQTADTASGFSFSDAISKGAPLALASGAYSLYNSTLGLATGKADLSKDLETYDQSWARYYNENQTAIDLTGNVAALLVPGTGAMKFLALAKDANTALGSMRFIKTLGNLDRAAAAWREEGIAASASQATADTLISASWKARAATAASALQDSAVITAASYAMMNQSQMFDDYGVNKFASDVLFGGVLGGIPGIIKNEFQISRGINAAAANYTALNYIKGNTAGAPTWTKIWGRLADSETAQDEKVASQAKNSALGMTTDLVPNGQEKLQNNLQPYLQQMSSEDFKRDFAGVNKISMAKPEQIRDITTGTGIKNFLLDRNVIQPVFPAAKAGVDTSVFTIVPKGTTKVLKSELAGQNVFTDAAAANSHLVNLEKATPGSTANMEVHEMKVRATHLYQPNQINQTGVQQALQNNEVIYAPTPESFEKPTAKIYQMTAGEYAKAVKDGSVRSALPSYYLNLLTHEPVESIIQTAGDKNIFIDGPTKFYMNGEAHNAQKFEGFFDHPDPAVSDGMFLLGLKAAENPEAHFKLSDSDVNTFKQNAAAGTPIPKFAVSDTNLIGMQSLLARAKAVGDTTIPIREGGPAGIVKVKPVDQVADTVRNLKNTLFQEGQKQGLTLDDLSVRLNMNAKKWVTGDQSEYALYKNLKDAESYASPVNVRVDLDVGKMPTREDYLASLDREQINEANRVNCISIQAPHFDDWIPHTAFVDGYKAKDFVPRTGLAGIFNFGGLGEISSASSYVERVGALVQNADMKWRSQVEQSLLPAVTELQKNPNAMFEFNNLVNTARSLPTGYSIIPQIKNVTGEDGLIKQVTVGKIQNRQTGEFLKAKRTNEAYPYQRRAPADTGGDDLDLTISPTVMRFHQTYEAIKSDFIAKANAIAEAKGELTRIDPKDLYYPPVDIRNRDYFAFVRGKDGKVTAITAGDAAGLSKQADALKQHFGDSVDILYKNNIKEYKQRFGDFDTDNFFRDYELDAAMRRSGKLSTLAPDTTDRSLQEVLNFARSSVTNLLRGATQNYMSKQMEELNFLSQQTTDAAQSRRGLLSTIGKRVNNPYLDYINTALNKNKLSTVPILESLNNSFSLMVNKAFNEISNMTDFTSNKPLEVEKGINYIQQRYGIKFDYAHPDIVKPINDVYDKQAANNIVTRYNGILTKLTLSLDGMFHAVHGLSGALLGAPELMNLRRNLTDPKTVQQIKDLTGIQIPGTDFRLPSTMKVMSKSIMKLFDKNDQSLNGYVKRGVIQSDILQYRETQLELADLMGKPPTSLPGKGLKVVNDKLTAAADFADKWTTEPTNKLLQFMAVDATHQMMDAMGLQDNTALKDTVANMIARRVNGNYISGQRPIIFQGPVGHALGLFQTFMFAAGQNLTRYIAEGDRAAQVTFALMQTGLFGAQSNALFQALNYHIGRRNATRSDLYSAAYDYGAVGDWALYGVPSNVLNLSLYHRGELTPINPTIIPTSIQDIPMVSAAVKLGQNIANTYQVLAKGGGDGDTFLRAVAMNGLNRPLAGLAQLVDGRSMFNSGETINGSIRDWTAWTRVIGGRPFDEQKIIDSYYRSKYYESYDINQLKTLGTAIRGKIAGGAEPTDDEMQQFLNSYIGSGGNARNFQRYWTQQMVTANTDLGNRLYMKMSSSPKFVEYQQILGGTSVRNPNGVYLGEPKQLVGPATQVQPQNNQQMETENGQQTTTIW